MKNKNNTSPIVQQTTSQSLEGSATDSVNVVIILGPPHTSGRPLRSRLPRQVDGDYWFGWTRRRHANLLPFKSEVHDKTITGKKP